MIRRGLIFLAIVCLASQILMVNPLHGQSLCESCVDSALQFLRITHDRFHNTFDVYTDQDAAGNHFAPSGWMPGSFPQNKLDYYGDWLQMPHSGNTCIRVTTTFQTGGGSWAGIYWQYPEGNWGTIPNAGYDLTGADSIVFYAKGENGGERVEFFAFGISGPYGDSESRYPPSGFTVLNSTWKRCSINLAGKDLSYVIGGFAFVVVKSDNGGNDITFYMDDIQYFLDDSTRQARLEEPRFLLSYEASFDTADYDEDFAIRNAAFTEYSALAMLALMADTSDLNSEDWQRAKRIGDAFVTAQENDRYFNVANELYDGRLRNGYMAGDLLDHLTGYTRIPGWWDPDSAKFFEVEFAAGTFTGAMAWVITAWLQYNHWKPQQSYVDAAVVLGNWIRARYDSDGYRAGFQGFDSTQTELSSKSVEHNILVYMAFTMLGKATDDTAWFNWADDARDWLVSQWDSLNGRFPEEPLTNIHALAFLCLGDFYAPGLDWVESNTLVDSCAVEDPFSGFDFDNDIDGVWFEGTAQMALAFWKNEEISKAQMYLEEIEDAQMNARNANGRGIVEACHDSVTTGLFDPGGNELFKINRLHTGSTSWYILASSGDIRTAVEAEENSRLPDSYRLESNYPNPFNPGTTIEYRLPKRSKVTLVVYNLLGQKIRTLVDERQSAGSYTVTWDGKDEFHRSVSSGMYFYRIIAENYVETRKMLLLR